MIRQETPSGNGNQSTKPDQREFNFTRSAQLTILRNSQVDDAIAKGLLRVLDDHIGDKNHWWDLCYAEIANEMNCSVSTVRRKESYLVDRALIDVEELGAGKRYRADGRGPLRRYRISWNNLEDTCNDPPVKPNNVHPGKLQVATPELQRATEKLQPANDTTYKRHGAPPPAPVRFPISAVVELLKANGVAQASQAAKAAESRGMSYDDVVTIVRELESRGGDFEDPPAVLFARLRDLDEFPPMSERTRVKQAEKRRRELIEAQQAKSRENAAKAAERARERASRPRFDDLPQQRQEELFNLAREKYPRADRRMLGKFARSLAMSEGTEQLQHKPKAMG